MSLSLICHILANQAPHRVTVTHVTSVTILSHFFKSMGVTVTCHTCDMTVTSLSRLLCHCPCFSGDNDLSSIEVVLTDFGLAGPDSKGGTPIFASPECLADPDRKDKSSDIFSLGRVFLMMILPKDKFLEFLFIPLTKGGKEEIMEMIENIPILNLLSQMMRIKKRIDLHTIRKELQSVFIYIKHLDLDVAISNIIKKSASELTDQYIDILKHFS